MLMNNLIVQSVFLQRGFEYQGVLSFCLCSLTTLTDILPISDVWKSQSGISISVGFKCF